MIRLVLVDAYAIIHRAYHAYPPLTSPTGEEINAVYGFTAMLLKVLDELKPSHLIVCFDLPVPTFRHEAYIGYQATRPHADDALKSQVQLVKDVIEAADIPIFSSPGYEADDVIGTLAKQVVQDKQQATNNKKVDEVIIVTGDRDMLQLVNTRVKVYMPIRGISEARLLDRNGVKEYLGIFPEKIVDYKALTGDSSDNYPGVPGIGPKTAIFLLETYGSLEDIYKALSGKGKGESLSQKVKQKLLDGYELALLSQKLAKISTDAPIEFELRGAKLRDLRTNNEFIDTLKSFGFRSLVSRLGGEMSKLKVKKKGNGGQMGLV